MKINVCKDQLEWGTEIREMKEANELLGDAEALKQRLHDDGYLLIRGLHPRDDVMTARAALLGVMEENGKKGLSCHNKDASHLPEVLAVLESPKLFNFFKDLFDEDALTFDEKWIRTVNNGGFTGLHFDTVYMGRGSMRLHTAWTPLGDLTKELGTLAVWTGNQDELAELKASYGALDVDRDAVDGGWLSQSPKKFLETFGGHWVATDVNAGDTIIINMFSMHCSTVNVTDDLRLSCDIRFQPASDPADERWFGENRTGHYSHHGGKKEDMGTYLKQNAPSKSEKFEEFLETL